MADDHRQRLDIKSGMKKPNNVLYSFNAYADDTKSKISFAHIHCLCEGQTLAKGTQTSIALNGSRKLKTGIVSLRTSRTTSIAVIIIRVLKTTISVLSIQNFGRSLVAILFRNSSRRHRSSVSSNLTSIPTIATASCSPVASLCIMIPISPSWIRANGMAMMLYTSPPIAGVIPTFTFK